MNHPTEDGEAENLFLKFCCPGVDMCPWGTASHSLLIAVGQLSGLLGARWLWGAVPAGPARCPCAEPGA